MRRQIIEINISFFRSWGVYRVYNHVCIDEVGIDNTIGTIVSYRGKRRIGWRGCGMWTTRIAEYVDSRVMIIHCILNRVSGNASVVVSMSDRNVERHIRCDG